MNVKKSTFLSIKVITLVFTGLALLSGKAFSASTCCGSNGKASAVPSLQEKLDTRANQFSKTAPEAIKKTFKNGIIHVKESGVTASALKTGDKAPNFNLPHANGQLISLSEQLKKGPVVIVWYRGGWCPYCNMQLHAMQEVLPQIKAAGAQMLAISPETPDHSLSTAERNDLKFYVLSDKDNQVAREYGIVYSLDENTHTALEDRLNISEHNGSTTKELPLTVAYVIQQDGTIVWDFVDPDYKKRAEPVDILKAIQSLKSSNNTGHIE